MQPRSANHFSSTLTQDLMAQHMRSQRMTLAYVTEARSFLHLETLLHDSPQSRSLLLRSCLRFHLNIVRLCRQPSRTARRCRSG